MKSFTGKTIYITGGSSGIGLAISRPDSSIVSTAISNGWLSRFISNLVIKRVGKKGNP